MGISASSGARTAATRIQNTGCPICIAFSVQSIAP
jgi:hypothetical protein